jgi:hypothetical protein
MGIKENNRIYLITTMPMNQSGMAEEGENFRRLGLGIIMLEEKLEELKTYSQEMERDKSKFDPDVLINISSRLVSAAYELSQTYENHKRARPTR